MRPVRTLLFTLPFPFPPLSIFEKVAFLFCCLHRFSPLACRPALAGFHATVLSAMTILHISRPVPKGVFQNFSETFFFLPVGFRFFAESTRTLDPSSCSVLPAIMRGGNQRSFLVLFPRSFGVSACSVLTRSPHKTSVTPRLTSKCVWSSIM